MIKKRVMQVIIAAGAMTILSSMPVMATQWKQDTTGWWYQNDDGSYLSGAWSQIGGLWYHFNNTGYMDANAWIGNYYVGADGAMLVNTTTPDGYQVGADGAWISSGTTAVTGGWGKPLVGPLTSIQSNGGDLYYSGLRKALDSIPLYPQGSTGDAELDRVMDDIFAQIINDNMDTHDKLLACYNYLIDNTEYGFNTGGPTAIFKEHLGVCDDYSEAFAYMAQKIGVHMQIAVGETHKSDGSFTGHAWCDLEYNGVHYIFDPQVEDVISSSLGNKIYIRFGGTKEQLADKYHYESVNGVIDWSTYGWEWNGYSGHVVYQTR